MAVPMNSTQFRSIVAPLLNEPFDGIYDMQDKQYQKYCNVQDGTPRSYHEEPVLYGFQQARRVPAGMPVPYQQGGQLFVKRYVYDVYGLAYAMTKVLVEDGDHIRLGRIFAKQAGNAMIETEETLAANVLNYSFNNAVPGGDGVSYVNSAHPGGPGASTYSNLLTVAAAMSQTSVEQLLIQIMYATDPTGKRINLKPKALVTGPSNSFQAGMILNTPLRTGTNNNDLNMVQYDKKLPGGVQVVSRVTSTTAWWILMDETSVPDGLKFLNRRKLEKSMEGDFITDSMRYKVTRRFVVSFTDPLSLYGTPGL